MGRKSVLYEGRNPEEAKELLDKKEIDYRLGFGDFSRFKDLPFSVVSEGMIDYYGLETIAGHFCR
jgi:hypothetical protein|tara:strand:- start:85 stop:279 length:195 start_codon:yes stop_codon:yes gene_type:complete